MSDEERKRVEAAITRLVTHSLEVNVGDVFSPERKAEIVATIQETIDRFLEAPHAIAYGITAAELRAVGFEIDESIPDDWCTKYAPRVVNARIDDDHRVHFQLAADFYDPLLRKS